MASSSKNKKTLMVAVVAIAVVLMANINAVSGSYLTVWSGPGCNNLAVRYETCGCSGIRLRGAYEFVYTGQSALLYDLPYCLANSTTTLSSNLTNCARFSWRSIFIIC
uniref:Antimicrobial peptide 1 n=1 Tax=Nelumbo nucifera TaxID=4432 RepID=A0A822XRI8_NELNU|nr:TPA_asm: hypothetical protein HUJ06_023746 [Nelumbo nucifera]